MTFNDKVEDTRNDKAKDTREMLQTRLNAPPAPPVEAAGKFFRAFFADDSWEEARERIIKLAGFNPRSIIAGLTGIESLLAYPPAKRGVLLDLVLWDANEPLANPSDESAKSWMREVVEMVREVLGDKQPPRPEAR